MEPKKVMLSGIKPSGDLTLGSYLGAIKNWKARADEYDCYYFMADLHAITVRQKPADLRRRTLEQLAPYIACGLDPEKNVLFIQSVMKQNKELINKLKQQVREGTVKGDQLKKIIDNLTQQMEVKDKQIQALKEELDKKDIHIAELDEEVANLNTNVNSLKEENTQKGETISSQDKALHTAWFVFGTKKELKEQKILDDGEVLRSNFNKEYFTKIDIRIDKEIKLYSKSAEILTDHPASSYTLQRDANKQYVLRINDPQSFWSTSKYLVIQVK